MLARCPGWPPAQSARQLYTQLGHAPEQAQADSRGLRAKCMFVTLSISREGSQAVNPGMQMPQRASEAHTLSGEAAGSELAMPGGQLVFAGQSLPWWPSRKLSPQLRLQQHPPARASLDVWTRLLSSEHGTHARVHHRRGHLQKPRLHPELHVRRGVNCQTLQPMHMCITGGRTCNPALCSTRHGTELHLRSLLGSCSSASWGCMSRASALRTQDLAASGEGAWKGKLHMFLLGRPLGGRGVLPNITMGLCTRL